MIPHDSLLVTLLQVVERIPTPPPPAKPQRGRPPTYSDRLFLKALVVMLVWHLHTAYELLAVLEQDLPTTRAVRACLTEGGRSPDRRTWERRLQALPTKLPAQIGCLGRHLVALIAPWATHGRAVALDSTVLRAKGGVWHKKHRDVGEIPHTQIDIEAAWTKSGWHGWVYGWKLHVAAVVAAVWIPVAAELTPANEADNEIAPRLLRHVPAAARFVLGDHAYNAPNVRQVCEEQDRILVATRHGAYPHTDGGVEVRRVFHKLRSLAIENFNQHFKSIFGAHGQVPTKGKRATQCFALGAIFVYQVALLYRFEQGLPLNVGLKAFLKAA